MSILKKHQRQDIRFKNDDIIMYEATDELKQELNDYVSKEVMIDENLNAKGEISASIIRKIIREMTNIGAEVDEYTDEELAEKLDNGDRVIQLLMREIQIFINELIEDMQFAHYETIEVLNKIANILKSNHSKEMVEDKFNKLMKKKGLDLKIEDFANGDIDAKELENRIRKIKSNTKKIKK